MKRVKDCGGVFVEVVGGEGVLWVGVVKEKVRGDLGVRRDGGVGIGGKEWGE